MKAIVYGMARPQGSPRGFVAKSGKVIVTEDTRGNRGYRSWRQSVTMEMLQDAPEQPWDCPVALELDIYVARPKYHYGQGKRASMLKPSAPAIPAHGIDIDKISRAVLDAGTGVLWRDDSRIARLTVRRFFADDGPERIEICANALSLI